MPGRLRPHLPFQTDETPVSFAVRLAAFHTRGRVLPFLNDLGIPVLDLIAAKRPALQRLSEASGVPLDTLRLNAIERRGVRDLSLRGEAFTKELLVGTRTRFCPLCLAQDDARGPSPAAQRRHRLMWRLRATRVCPVHGITLLDRSQRRWLDKAHELAVLVPERGAQIARLAEGLAPIPEPSPLQAYLSHRLDGRRRSDWLDGQGIEQAVLATDMLGAVLTFGPDVSIASLALADWDRASRAGFEFTSRGEPGLREAFDLLLKENSPSRGAATPGKVFGTLYHRLSQSSGKDVGPIRPLLRAFIFETMAVPAGVAILGDRLPRRRLHTVASLAKDHSLDSRTLRHLLVAEGLVRPDLPPAQDVAFDAAAGARLAQRAKDPIAIAQLREALGCTRPQAQQLVAAGLLRPLVTEPAHARGALRHSVPRTEVDRFLDRLRTVCPEVTEVPPSFIPIAKAAERWKRGAADIMARLLDGEIPGAVRGTGETGLAAVRLPPDGLPKATNTAGPDTMGLTQLCLELRLSHAEARRLLALRPAAPILPHTVIGTTKSSRRLPKLMFHRQDIEAFNRDYATLSTLCRETGRHHQTVMRALTQAGVRPVADPKVLGFTLFRRSDIPRHLDL
jgi:hypothetical protein